MIVPIEKTGRDVPKRGNGIIHANRTLDVDWERTEELGGLHISRTDAMRFGQNASVYSLHISGNGDLVTPCYVLPVGYDPPIVFDLIIETYCKSTFELSGIQAYLWHSAYSEIHYQDFLGGIDRKFIHTSKTRKISSNDKIVIELQSEGCFGVCELIALREESVWEARLYLSTVPAAGLMGLELFSVHGTSLDGVSATFRRLFAKVVSIQATV